MKSIFFTLFVFIFYLCESTAHHEWECILYQPMDVFLPR